MIRERGRKKQSISFSCINKMVIGFQTVYNAFDLLIIRIGVCYFLDVLISRIIIGGHILCYELLMFTLVMCYKFCVEEI